jgi:hypothetical protein
MFFLLVILNILQESLQIKILLHLYQQMIHANIHTIMTMYMHYFYIILV